MNPRGFWSTFLALTGITSLSIAVLWSLLFSFGTGTNIGQTFFELGIWIGLISGLLISFIMAFFIRAITITMRMTEKNQFINDLNVILAELGYHPQSQYSDLFLYKPSFQAGLLAGKISVQINNEGAIIVGPSIYVTKLEKKMNIIVKQNNYGRKK